ncbi:hypothetical protein BGZ83_001710 [Gryganskiella cystojenkinii]|nr:hypothetical protein BGZ83_001710 [Gryganskiella cystojenkinii]
MMQAAANPEGGPQTSVDLSSMNFEKILALGYPFRPIRRFDVNKSSDSELRSVVETLCVKEGTPIVLEGFHKHKNWDPTPFTFPFLDDMYGKKSKISCRDLANREDVEMLMGDYIRQVHPVSFAKSFEDQAATITAEAYFSDNENSSMMADGVADKDLIAPSGGQNSNKGPEEEAASASDSDDARKVPSNPTSPGQIFPAETMTMHRHQHQHQRPVQEDLIPSLSHNHPSKMDNPTLSLAAKTSDLQQIESNGNNSATSLKSTRPRDPRLAVVAAPIALENLDQDSNNTIHDNNCNNSSNSNPHKDSSLLQPCNTIPPPSQSSNSSASDLLMSSSYTTPRRKRGKLAPLIYAKDLTCPDAWRRFLDEFLPRWLVYMAENDLMSHVDPELAAENLMVYIGQAGTWTPTHLDQCGAIGHNVMAWADDDSSSIWFMVETKDREKARALWASFRQPIDYEGYFASVEEMMAADFPIYVVEQKIGDFVMVPSMSYHQVVNLGKATIKVSWNRQTAHCLKSAINTVLPRYREIARTEGYRINLVVQSALSAFTRLLQDQKPFPAALPNDYFMESFKDLLELFQIIVESEWIELGENNNAGKDSIFKGAPKRIEDSTPAVCDFCNCDIWNRHFRCSTCDFEGDDYDTCLTCFSIGRGCAHRASTDDSVEFVESFSMSSLRRLFTEAIQAWNESKILASYGGYKTMEDPWVNGHCYESKKIEDTKESDREESKQEREIIEDDHKDGHKMVPYRPPREPFKSMPIWFTRPDDDYRNRGGVMDFWMNHEFARDVSRVVETEEDDDAYPAYPDFAIKRSMKETKKRAATSSSARNNRSIKRLKTTVSMPSSAHALSSSSSSLFQPPPGNGRATVSEATFLRGLGLVSKRSSRETKNIRWMVRSGFSSTLSSLPDRIRSQPGPPPLPYATFPLTTGLPSPTGSFDPKYYLNMFKADRWMQSQGDQPRAHFRSKALAQIASRDTASSSP